MTCVLPSGRSTVPSLTGPGRRRAGGDEEWVPGRRAAAGADEFSVRLGAQGVERAAVVVGEHGLAQRGDAAFLCDALVAAAAVAGRTKAKIGESVTVAPGRQDVVGGERASRSRRARRCRPAGPDARHRHEVRPGRLGRSPPHRQGRNRRWRSLRCSPRPLRHGTTGPDHAVVFDEGPARRHRRPSPRRRFPSRSPCSPTRPAPSQYSGPTGPRPHRRDSATAEGPVHDPPHGIVDARSRREAGGRSPVSTSTVTAQREGRPPPPRTRSRPPPRATKG